MINTSTVPPSLPFALASLSFFLSFPRHWRNRPKRIRRAAPRRAAPNGPDPDAVPPRFRISAGFRTTAGTAAVEAAAARRTRRRYNRSAGSPLADRSARDLISRTRAETQCVKLRLAGAGAHEKRSAQRRSERVHASLLACLPDCLTPASCLPASFGGEQPAASTVVCLASGLFTC